MATSNVRIFSRRQRREMQAQIEAEQWNRKRKIAMFALLANDLKKLIEAYEEDEQKKMRRKKLRAKRACWVQPYLQRRLEQGNYDNLMQELKNKTPELFRNFTRTSGCLFDEIVEKVTPYIEKEETFSENHYPWSSCCNNTAFSCNG